MMHRNLNKHPRVLRNLPSESSAVDEDAGTVEGRMSTRRNQLQLEVTVKGDGAAGALVDSVLLALSPPPPPKGSVLREPRIRDGEIVK